MKPTRHTRETVVNSLVIQKLLRESRFAEAFPWLKATVLAAQPGCCPNKKHEIPADSTRIKTQLANMPAADQAKLKEMLGASMVRIVIQAPGAKVRIVTF